MKKAVLLFLFSLIFFGVISQNISDQLDYSIPRKFKVAAIDVKGNGHIDKNIIIDSVNETDCIVTLEEHSLIGGLGGAVSEVLMQEAVYPKKFKMLGLESEFSTIVGSQNYLRKINKIDKKSVVKEIITLLKWKE